MIDRIYIIVSQEKEPDRYEYLNRHIPISLKNYQNKVVLYEPYYKNRDEDKIKDINFIEKLKVGEKMLLATYIKLFDEIIEKETGDILILESDVLYANNFSEKLEEYYNEWLKHKKEGSVLFLGNGCNLHPNYNNRISSNLFLQNTSKCTDSMLMDIQSIKIISEYIKKLNIIEKPIDHLLNNIFGKTIYGYWIVYPIIYQGSQNGTYKSSIQ